MKKKKRKKKKKKKKKEKKKEKKKKRNMRHIIIRIIIVIIEDRKVSFECQNRSDGYQHIAHKGPREHQKQFPNITITV